MFKLEEEVTGQEKEVKEQEKDAGECEETEERPLVSILSPGAQKRYWNRKEMWLREALWRLKVR